jgi:DNA polymerase III subunit epsilon
MRLKVLLPLVLAALTAITVAVPIAALWSSGAEISRVGTLVSLSLGTALIAFAAAWSALYLLVQKPLTALARDALILAQAPQERGVHVPALHALDRMPASVAELQKRLVAARADTNAAVEAATRRVDEQRSRLEAILLDLTEGVIVCNLDHRILLYNQAAARILDLRETLGLGRPLFGLLTSEPILHMLEQMLPPGDAPSATPAATMDAVQGHESRRFVCATHDLGRLLEARMSVVLEANGTASGYVLTFADVSARIESLALRDHILREVMVEWRRPLANLTAASEMLEDADTLSAAERGAFQDIIGKEVAALNARFRVLSRSYEQLAAGPWPMADVHSLDLFRAVRKHLAAGDDATEITLVGVPAWLHADSHSLMLALAALIQRARSASGKTHFDVEAVRRANRVYVEISWEGSPLATAELDSWLDEPLLGTIANRTIRQIVERHGSELWSESLADGRTVIRIPLRPPSHPPTDALSRARLAPRPEFYDFDLFEAAHAELSETPLQRMSYVVFDCETTGLRPSQGDELVSVGAIRVVNGRILTGETFERLINPGRPIPDASRRIHGISDDMVRDRPPVEIVLPQLKSYVGDAVLVAYNAAFDMKFLELKEAATGVRFENAVLDALLLAIYLFPDAPDHSLSGIARQLGIDIAGRHTALGDAMMTAAVWVRLLDLLVARGVATFGDAVRISSRMMQERKLLAQF